MDTRPVKEGHRSGSYDDKMNTLQGDPLTDLGFRREKLKAYMDEMSRLTEIMQRAAAAMLAEGKYNNDDFKEQSYRLALGQKLDQYFQKTLYGAAALLDANYTVAGGANLNRITLDRILTSGLARSLMVLRQAASLAGTPVELRGTIRNTFDILQEAGGIDADQVITQGATQLANFLIDGTYTFNYILSQTPSQPNGATGTGTATITSEIDKYTNGLAQKLINQTITTPFSMNILQTLDISYNSILIDTYGTSNTGDYTIEGNTLTITSYGYSNDKIFFGEFITDVVKIIKTDIGYIVQHNKINPDNNVGPLIDVVYYVRQKTISDELAAEIYEVFGTLDTDGDGRISREDATKLMGQFGIPQAGLPANVQNWTPEALTAYRVIPSGD